MSQDILYCISYSRPLVLPLPSGLGLRNRVACVGGRKKRKFAIFSFALVAFAFFTLFFLRASRSFFASSSRARKKAPAPTSDNVIYLLKINVSKIKIVKVIVLFLLCFVEGTEMKLAKLNVLLTLSLTGGGLLAPHFLKGL
jgi:hypothetical protein